MGSANHADPDNRSQVERSPRARQPSSWRKLRERYFRSHPRRCGRCRRTRGIDLHHFSYVRWGEESQSDLVALCRPCHRAAHAAYWADPALSLRAATRRWVESGIAPRHRTAPAIKGASGTGWLVAQSLMHVYSELEGLLAARLRGASGISIERSWALYALRDGPVPSAEAACRAGLTAGGWTRAADALVAAGLATRRRDRGDRRVVLTRLTRAGRKALSRAETIALDALQATLAYAASDRRLDLETGKALRHAPPKLGAALAELNMEERTASETSVRHS